MPYVEVGLFIFWCAFILCIPGAVWIGETWRLVDILKANPHFYMSYVLNALFYLVLPSALGLAIILIGFVKSRKAFLRWWFAVAGGILLSWGLFGLYGVCASYYSAMNMVTKNTISISHLLSLIYGTHLIAKIPWLLAGALLTYSYLYNTLRNEWDKYIKAPIVLPPNQKLDPNNEVSRS